MVNPLENKFQKKPCVDPDCLCHFATKEEWCEHRNRNMARQDLEWAVDSAGSLYLRVKESWSSANQQAEKARKEDERRRFNWCQDHPITE